jgi:hypothetical protein
MDGELEYGDVHDAYRDIRDCGDAILRLQQQYDEDWSNRAAYQGEVEQYLEQARAIAEDCGLTAFDESDWTGDAETPQVAVPKDDAERPAEEYAVDLFAEAYNALQQVEALADAFPRIDLPDGDDEIYDVDLKEGNGSKEKPYIGSIAAIEPQIEHAYTAGKETRSAVKRELKEQHDVSTTDELREQFVDPDTGEPYTRKAFRKQLREIAGDAEQEPASEELLVPR